MANKPKINMKNKKKRIQPTPKKGFEFTGWTTFNWGVCHHSVYRTRAEAKQSLTNYDYTWDEMKHYMKIVKVKCTVL